MKGYSYDKTTLHQVLNRIQRFVLKQTGIGLITEPQDWYIVMQVLRERGILRTPPKRIPIAPFLQLLKDAEVTYVLSMTRPSRHVLWDCHRAEKQERESYADHPRKRVLKQTLYQLLDEAES